MCTSDLEIEQVEPKGLRKTITLNKCPINVTEIKVFHYLDRTSVSQSSERSLLAGYVMSDLFLPSIVEHIAVAERLH